MPPHLSQVEGAEQSWCNSSDPMLILSPAAPGVFHAILSQAMDSETPASSFRVFIANPQ